MALINKKNKTRFKSIKIYKKKSVTLCNMVEKEYVDSGGGKM